MAILKTYLYAACDMINMILTHDKCAVKCITTGRNILDTKSKSLNLKEVKWLQNHSWILFQTYSIAPPHMTRFEQNV